MSASTSLLPPEYQVNDFAVSTERAIVACLHQNGIYEADFSLSPNRIKSASFYFLRDMYRIETEQNGKISATKFAGYWAFWIRKIKPIGYAFNTDHPRYSQDIELSEIVTINEATAIDVAINFLASEGKGKDGGGVHDFIRFGCSKNCNGATCLTSYAQKFFEFHDSINQKYLLNSLMHRTFGPHHLTIIFEHLVFGGCRGVS